MREYDAMPEHVRTLCLTYVHNDPVNATDPDGRQSRFIPVDPDQVTTTSQTTTTNNADGSATVSRQNVTQIPLRTGVVNTTTNTGSIKLLPQASANGAPANVTSDMQESLLNFSNAENTQVEVTSGVRTPTQNAAVGGAPGSSHLTTNGDQAADIRIAGSTAEQTADAAYASGEFNRVNEYTDGRGVHVDLRETGNQGRFTDWRHEPD